VEGGKGKGKVERGKRGEGVEERRGLRMMGANGRMILALMQT